MAAESWIASRTAMCCMLFMQNTFYVHTECVHGWNEPQTENLFDWKLLRNCLNSWVTMTKYNGIGVNCTATHNWAGYYYRSEW